MWKDIEFSRLTFLIAEEKKKALKKHLIDREMSFQRYFEQLIESELTKMNAAVAATEQRRAA